MRWRMRGAWLAAAGAMGVGVAVAGLAAGLMLAGRPGGARALPSARARPYLNVDACLLAGANGVAVAPDSRVWSALESVSGSTDVRVSYLAVTGSATEGNAVPFLGSLVLRGCRVIVAADGPERAAVAADARRFPAVRFVVVGGGGGSAGGNVTALSAGSASLTATLDSAVRSAVVVSPASRS